MKQDQSCFIDTTRESKAQQSNVKRFPDEFKKKSLKVKNNNFNNWLPREVIT